MKSIEKVINDLDWLRKNLIGRNILFDTPFGKRPLVYADYTASGRGVKLIEDYIRQILPYYANTHTEDDFTGKFMTDLLEKSQDRIKDLVNAGDKGKIIFAGSGTTGGVTRLLQILGIYWSPRLKKRIIRLLDSCKIRNNNRKLECHKALLNYIEDNKPLVYIGPYEHHSNELIWRKSLCEVVRVPLTKEGEINLEFLEKHLKNRKNTKRMTIGSFSAASNVTGIKTPVYKLAKLLHKYNALACFDFAASGPYVEIDMNHDEDSYFDAIFLSPHKFLGGPGATGILLFNEKIYPYDLPPTVSGGGTVDFVNREEEHYTNNIEEREKPGTPGILQAIKASLVFQLKDIIGLNNIEKIEQFYKNKFFSEFKNNEKIIIYGSLNPSKRVGIISFNIKHNDRYLHPKFITTLLNDLFGIQSRAGCSCAGPYGHELLGIDHKQSSKYYNMIVEKHLVGIKPGWTRINLHYSFSIQEIDYMIKSIKFIIDHGYKLIPLYNFNFSTGEWKHINYKNEISQISLEEMTKNNLNFKHSTGNIKQQASYYLQYAKQIAEEVEQKKYKKFSKEIEELMNFYVINPKRNK